MDVCRPRTSSGSRRFRRAKIQHAADDGRAPVIIAVPLVARRSITSCRLFRASRLGNDWGPRQIGTLFTSRG